MLCIVGKMFEKEPECERGEKKQLVLINIKRTWLLLSLSIFCFSFLLFAELTFNLYSDGSNVLLWHGVHLHFFVHRLALFVCYNHGCTPPPHRHSGNEKWKPWESWTRHENIFSHNMVLFTSCTRYTTDRNTVSDLNKLHSIALKLSYKTAPK